MDQSHDPGVAERALVLSYAPPPSRAGLGALFALDDALADVVRTTREPAIGQIRLAWWDDALRRLDSAPPLAQPVLQQLAADVLPTGVSGADLASLIDGWEVLVVEETLTDAALRSYAAGRGAGWFQLAARLLGDAPGFVEAAGEGWALADLAGHVSDPKTAARAGELAREVLAPAMRSAWPVRVRALGAMTRIAWFEVSGGPAAGSVPRMLRLAWHRLSGR